MLALARWCVAHRRRVVVIWIVLAIAVSVIAQAAGRDYANNFSLPGTQAQRAVDLLEQKFPSQSGDLDQVVWHTGSGTVDSPAVKAAIEPLLAKISHLPHVVGVVSPYSPAGAAQVSRAPCISPRWIGHTMEARVSASSRNGQCRSPTRCSPLEVRRSGAKPSSSSNPTKSAVASSALLASVGSDSRVESSFRPHARPTAIALARGSRSAASAVIRISASSR